ncbi:MAG: hypothetical protein LBU75_13945 [Desulfovibrio sp.]|nr:hypothetical protein [Desulfovibrio sp.]
MKATSAMRIFPFSRSIHLVRDIHTNGVRHHWKAEAELYLLKVSTWTGDDEEPHPSRVTVHTIGWGQCIDEDPVQEMWRQAAEKIEKDHYHFHNGI